MSELIAVADALTHHSETEWTERQFVMVGSKIGKEVIAATLSRKFARAVGIEELQGLHLAAEGALLKLQQDPFWSANVGDSKPSHCELVNADVFTSDWSFASVAFIPCTF